MNEDNNEVQVAETNNKSKKNIIIVLVVLLIVVISCIFFIVKIKNKDTSSNAESNGNIIDNNISVENDTDEVNIDNNTSVENDTDEVNIDNIDDINESLYKKISLDGSKEYILLMNKVDSYLDKIDFSNKTKYKENLFEDSFLEFELVSDGIKYTNIDGKSIVYNTNASDIISIRLICNGNAGLCGELYYLTKDNVLYKVTAKEDLTRDKLKEEKISEDITAIATFDNPLAVGYTEKILVTKNKDNKINEYEKIDFYSNISVYGGYNISPVYAISKDKENLFSKYVSSKVKYITDTKGNKIVGKSVKELEDDDNYKLIVETVDKELYEIEFK